MTAKYIAQKAGVDDFIAEAKPEVDVTAVVNDNIVGVEYKNQIAISFHPELDESTKIHERFLKMCESPTVAQA